MKIGGVSALADTPPVFMVSQARPKEGRVVCL